MNLLIHALVAAQAFQGSTLSLNLHPGEAMPTTSDRFFALAARVESALPDAGLTKEQAAELVGALKAYWEAPSEQALVALKAAHRGVWNTAICGGKLDPEHSALSANNALCRAAEEFFANESEPDMVVSYLDKCDRLLVMAP